MVKDDPSLREQNPQRRPAFSLLTLGLAAAVVLVTGVLMGCWLRESSQENEPLPEASVRFPAATAATKRLFRGWSKPDIAILLSGEEHGYLQPCGCSRPQVGGLARRFNFLHTLKEKGWPVVAVDLGDVAQKSGPQSLLKYKTAMEARQLLDYLAVGIGPTEMGLPLFEALGNFALNNDKPRVLAANLIDKEKNFPGMVRSWEIGGGQGGVPKIGVVGVVGPSAAAQVQDREVQFTPPEKILPTVLQEIHAQQPELLVLLYQGTLAEAKACAAKFPQFPVVLCQTRESEPAGRPERVGNAMVIGVGHKARYVGVVGANRTGRREQPFELRYQLVSILEDYETPEGQDAKNPVHGLLENYAREIQRGNYLARYPQMKHPLQVDYPNASYVGSEKCKKCHETAYTVWKAEIRGDDDYLRSHSRAYASLVHAKRPVLRQYDAECVQCHVTGFGHLTGFKNETETPILKDVGCEVCHGPGSAHIKDNYDAKLNKLMNPHKPQPDETPQQKQQRINALDQFCQKCHDTDNDVHWKIDKWEKIAHPEPKAGN